MGIPYYFYVISRSTPGILLTECPAGCADYFLDYNGVIHQAVAEIMDELSALPAGEIPAQDDPALEARMHKAIWDYTESCIRVVAPSQQVSICIDGVAPVAKMVQQRKRRYLSGLKYRLDGQPVPWDRNAISPGTPFMIRLHASLRAAIRNRDGRGGPYIYLSTSEDPGEGEHKIFQRIAGLSRAPAAGGGGGPAPIVIHGLDADLIMLSLLSDTPGIYLMREPTHVVKPGDATSAAPGIPKLDPETTPFVYVSVDALRVALLADLSRTFRWSVDAAARADAYSPSACAVIRDYVALCFLLGNDFLPHPATLSLKHGGHDRLLHAARSATEATGLTMTGVAAPGATGVAAGAAIVNAHYVAHVVRELAREEEPLLAEYAAKYLKRTPRPPPGGARFAPSEFYPLRPEHKDPCARALGDGGALKPAWQSTYYQHLFHTRMHDTRTMTTACQLFAHGLQWTLSYYKRQPKDALWYYPFGFAPTFRDLANFVASRPDALNPAPGAPAAAAAPSGFVDAMIQLLCIMPPESAGILPQHVRTLMTVPEYGCTHLFPRGYPIQTFLKTHLWECHPVLPALDIALMQRALSSLTTARRATEASPKRACDLARPTGPTAPTAPPPRSGPSAADRGPPQIPLRGPANVRYSSFGASGRAAVGRFRSAPGVPAAIAPAAAPPTKAAPR